MSSRAPLPVDAALEFVNELRAKHNAKPLTKLPRGECNNSVRCPISNGLRDVGGFTWYAGDFNIVGFSPATSERIMLPAAVAEFVWLFDHGHYPDLILPKER